MPSPSSWSPISGEQPPSVWTCKICGSEAARVFAFTPEQTNLVEAVVMPQGYARPYYRCPRCGLLFHPAFDSLPEEHHRLYELPGLGDALDKQINRARRELIMVDAFRRLHDMKPSANILVFGCGSGLSFNYLLASGFNAYASDLTIQFKQTAKMFADYGFRQDLMPEMLHRFRALTDIPVGSLDIITMTEVFEHLLDPVDMMGQLVRLLRPGGLIIGTTGWVNRVREELREWWYLKCLTHATFLSSEGFRRLCAATGCLGTLYPSTPLLLGDSKMSNTQCMFAMQRPL